MKLTSAFSLLELILIIAILGVFVVVLLIALNPEEIQKKTRDTKRLRDAVTLQGILEQVVREDIDINATAIYLGASSKDVPQGTTSCDSSNWLGLPICRFTSSAPLDPQNGEVAEMVKGAGKRTGIMYYRAKMQGSEYEINVRQESRSNANKVVSDGGNSDEWFEIFSSQNDLF